jgi:hypothetical protein
MSEHPFSYEGDLTRLLWYVNVGVGAIYMTR